MGVIVFLRKTDKLSYFRYALFSIINHPSADSIIIGSGYFQEMPNSSQYSASLDELIDVLNNSSIQKIYVIGCMPNNKQNMQIFINNLQNLKAKNGNPRFVVKKSWKNFNNWHAKISLVFNKETALAAVIGSSNMTRRAYGENQGAFNVEADTLIWIPDSKMDKHFREYDYFNKKSNDVVELHDNIFSPFYLEADTEKEKIGEAKRLQGLFSEIIQYVELF